jgi:ribose/xylose/arabinose/galactoside ABC-type transport system permease subunit
MYSRWRLPYAGANMVGQAAGSRARSERGLYIAVGGLLVAALVIFLASGVNFFKFTNLLNIARGFSMLSIAALGQTFVIIGGGLDLSVAEVISTANVFAATFMAGKNELFLPITLLTLAFGALVGLFNALLVTKRGVPAFVATLGSAIVLRGARLMWTKGLPRGYIPDNLTRLGVGTTLGIPNLFYVFLAVAVLASLVLTRMGYGRRLYAVGTNPAVASLSGVRTDRTVILSYVLCSVLSAFVGILLGGYTDMSDEKIGEGYDLDTIAVAVLGGAAIGGGTGSVRGTIIAAVIILVLTNLSLLMGFPIQSQMVIKGLVIILALMGGRRGA